MPLLVTLENLAAFTAEEAATLREEVLTAPASPFRAGDELQLADAPIDHACWLKEGWASWHGDLRDGRRQIFDFVLPGDVFGFASMALSYRSVRNDSFGPDTAKSITAITDGSLVRLDRMAFADLLESQPTLVALILALQGSRTSRLVARRLTELGQFTARERIAAFLLDLWERLRRAGLTDDRSFELPAPQYVLSEALGLSTVHLSRTMGQLQRDGLFSISSSGNSISSSGNVVRRFVFHDRDALHALANA